MVAEETDWYLLDLLRLWWRYGSSFIRLQMWLEEIMEKFIRHARASFRPNERPRRHSGRPPVTPPLCPGRIYKYQARGYAFGSLEELLESLGGSGFVNMTRRPLSDSLLELGVSQRFIDEVVAPVIRLNYGQNVSVPAFVGQRPRLAAARRKLRSDPNPNVEAIALSSSLRPQAPCRWPAPSPTCGRWKAATSCSARASSSWPTPTCCGRASPPCARSARVRSQLSSPPFFLTDLFDLVKSSRRFDS